MSKNLLPVAQDGWIYIGYSVGFVFLFAFLGLEFLLIASLVFTLIFLYIFRNPEREIPIFEEDSVLSPVDGTISSIEELDGSEYIYKVTIDGSFFDVALLRAPMNADVIFFEKKNGSKLQLNSPLAEKINESASIVFQSSHANNVKVDYKANQSFFGIKLNNLVTKKMRQSSRYGVMVHGRTTLLLPQNFRLNVTLGEHLKAGESLVGYFS